MGWSGLERNKLDYILTDLLPVEISELFSFSQLYPSFDQARKIISIIAYMNSEIDFKGDDKAHTKLSRTINRYSFVFCSGNVFDPCFSVIVRCPPSFVY